MIRDAIFLVIGLCVGQIPWIASKVKARLAALKKEMTP